MVKDLAHYMNLDYPVEVKRIPPDEGGGYQAAIPLLGKYAFLGDGETKEQALLNLERTKKFLFRKYLLNNKFIPEP